MTVDKRICLFRFQANNFQTDCYPFPRHVIAVIDAYMPQIAIVRNEKLQETMRDALKMLDRDPESVEEFVEHLAILSRINNELRALEKEFLIVTRLFTIAHDFSLKIDPEQYAFYKSLGSTFHHLKSSLLYTEAQSEENIRKFTVNLTTLINKIQHVSLDLRIRLQSPLLLSSDTTSQVAAENLQLFEEMIKKLVERAKNYASYQERFGNTMKSVKKRAT
jgi:dynein heavy chain